MMNMKTEMFPDSEIAKEFAMCANRKATTVKESLHSLLTTCPDAFSILTKINDKFGMVL